MINYAVMDEHRSRFLFVQDNETVWGQHLCNRATVKQSLQDHTDSARCAEMRENGTCIVSKSI